MKWARRRIVRAQHHCALPKSASKSRDTREGPTSQIVVLVACLMFIAAPAAAQSEAAIQKEDDKWAEAFNKGDVTALGRCIPRTLICCHRAPI